MSTATTIVSTPAPTALGEMARVLEELCGTQWWQLGEADLASMLGSIGVLRHRLARLEAHAMAQSLEQGIPDARGLRPVDYLLRAGSEDAPQSTAAQARGAIRIAEAIREVDGIATTDDGGALVGAAVAEDRGAAVAEDRGASGAAGVGSGGSAGDGGEGDGVSGAAAVGPADLAGVRGVLEAFDAELLSASKAAAILRFREQGLATCDEDDLNEMVDVITGRASDALPDEPAPLADGTLDTAAGFDPLGRTRSRMRGFTDREVGVLTSRALRLIKGDEAVDAEQRRLERGRSLYALGCANGMTEYRLVLEAEAAAIVDAAVSALSAPVPEADGSPDVRGAARRRADALITVIQRGVSAPGDVPKTDKAQVIVTMGWDELSGQVRGTGLSMTGHVLSAATVRKMACDASIIPAVLGGSGEILELGRAARLFTAGQIRALWQRDGGCTFPGCSIPAQWCQAHHVVHWIHGGPTDLSNGALLCQRHHSKVHQLDLKADVTITGVRWHT